MTSKLPESIRPGDELDVNIAPFGEWVCHDGSPSNDGRLQVVDDAALDQVVAAFDGDVLVDVDHRSEEDGPTEAAAWVTRLFKDPEKGLMARFKFTPLGADAVTERRYRYTSPVWFIDPDGRPRKLNSVAITNRPNMPVPPLLNARRGGGATRTDDLNNPKKERIADNPRNQKERNPSMDEIKNALGLPPDATDEQIAEAVKALQAKNAELEAAKNEAAAEAFAEEHKDKCDKAALKNAYKASPEVATSLVKNMKAADPNGRPLCNSKHAKAPAVLPAKNARTQHKDLGSPEARVKFALEHADELKAAAEGGE